MFRGATISGSWRRTASASRSFSAVWASAYTSALSADAADRAACSLARRSASSSCASRAFRSVASRRSAAGSMHRLLEEVVADLGTEAAPDFSRVSGALKQENKSEGFHTIMTKIQGVKEGYLRRHHNRHLRPPLILGHLGRGLFPPGHRG